MHRICLLMSILGIGLIFSFTNTVHSKLVDVTIEKKLKSKDVEADGQRHFNAEQTTDSIYSFIAKIRLWAPEPIKVSLKLSVVGKTYVWKNSESETRVIAVLKKKDIETSSAKIKEVNLGEAEFSRTKGRSTTFSRDSANNTTTTTVTDYRGGVRYSGYILEVYHEGKLIDRQYQGGSKVKKLYKKMQKNKFSRF